MDYRERDPYTGCVSNTGYLAHGNNNGEAKRRSRHKNNIGVVRNLDEKNVSTKGKSLKQGPTRAEDLTIKLSEVSNSPCHKLEYK